jgi:hypothetical protein
MALRKCVPRSPYLHYFALPILPGKHGWVASQYDRFPNLIAELVAAKVDITALTGAVTARAAKAATHSDRLPEGLHQADGRGAR